MNCLPFKNCLPLYDNVWQIAETCWVLNEWVKERSTGANELQMKVCFRPNLIYSKSFQPNEDCRLKGSHTKITTSEARAIQKPFNAAPCKGKHFFRVIWDKDIYVSMQQKCHNHPVINHQGLLWVGAFFPLTYTFYCKGHFLSSGHQWMKFGARKCLAQWLALSGSIATCSRAKERMESSPFFWTGHHCNSLGLVCSNCDLLLI